MVSKFMCKDCALGIRTRRFIGKVENNLRSLFLASAKLTLPYEGEEAKYCSSFSWGVGDLAESGHDEFDQDLANLRYIQR